MPTTPSLAIPYPAPTATPDVPYDLQQLAENLDASLASARPRVGLSISVNQSITTSGTLQAISWDTEGNPADVGGMHNGTNPTRVTATKAGCYLVTGGAEFANNTTGFRRIQVRTNGATFGAAADVGAVAGGVGTQLVVATLWQAALNDYMELVATQTSTAALNVVTGGSTFFQAVWLCP